MSTICFSALEISEIASSFYQEFGEFIDTYQDRQVAKQEALHEYEKRDDLSIRLDEYRFFWERVSLSNQLEYLKNYTKYGESSQVEYNQIDVLRQGMPMTKGELYHKLKSIRYNSSEFLEPRITQRLDRMIDLISDQLIRELEK